MHPAVLAAEVTDYRYSIIRSYPHAPDVFTQGLEFHRGMLYESSGGYGKSRMIKRTLESAQPARVTFMPKYLFGEGITLFGGRLYQLTWRAQRGFIYDPDDLALLDDFQVTGEGWGLTNDGEQLISSDGSDTLYYLDPQDFSVRRRLLVTLGGKPLTRLNELEWIDDLIYANVWRTDWIVMIDPMSGQVVGRVGLHRLLPDELRSNRTGVLNGIAYDRERKRLLVTGKNWPRLYHIAIYE